MNQAAIRRGLPQRQAGLTFISLMLIFGLIAFFATLVIKCMPLYMNQLKIAKAVNGIVDDPEKIGRAHV
jgi:hypothetical protein